MTANILAVVNCLLALILGICAGWLFRYSRNVFHLLLAIIGIAWCVLYAWVIFADPANYNAAWFGQTFIRPLNTITFGIMAALVIDRLRDAKYNHS